MVEGSVYGVMAASAAGMRCIAVPYVLDAPIDPAFATADLLLRDGMVELAPDRVHQWILDEPRRRLRYAPRPWWRGRGRVGS